jgi:Stress up-regulated Nod 19
MFSDRTQFPRQVSPSLGSGKSDGFLSGIINQVLGSLVPQYKPYKMEIMQPSKSESGRKKVRFTFGPFELKPASVKRAAGMGKMDPNSDQFMGIVTGLPLGSLVLSTNSSLTYEDGSIADVVNGVYNHHLIIADTNQMGGSPTKCLEGGFTMPDMGLLMGASEANRDLEFSSSGSVPSGFKTGKNDLVVLSAELVNYTNDTKKVYSVSDVEYIESPGAGSIHASLNIFDTTTCDSSASSQGMAPTHGRTKWSNKSKKVQITKDGYILTRRGHMHDGGENVQLLLNGKDICKSTAIYGGSAATTVIDGKEWATISRMETCSDPVKVKTGDILEVVANFDLDKHPA